MPEAPTTTSRFPNTNALRAYWAKGGPEPGTEQGDKLVALSQSKGLMISPNGAFAIRPTTKGKYELSLPGAGRRIQAGELLVLEIKGKARAIALSDFIAETVFNVDGEAFDWSHPEAPNRVGDFVTKQGENILQALVRARAEFDAPENPNSDANKLHARIGIIADLPEAPAGTVRATDLKSGMAVINSSGEALQVAQVEPTSTSVTVRLTNGIERVILRNDLVAASPAGVELLAQPVEKSPEGAFKSGRPIAIRGARPFTLSPHQLVLPLAPILGP